MATSTMKGGDCSVTDFLNGVDVHYKNYNKTDRKNGYANGHLTNGYTKNYNDDDVYRNHSSKKSHMNGTISNGYANNTTHFPAKGKFEDNLKHSGVDTQSKYAGYARKTERRRKPRPIVESFEGPTFISACLTHLGFYILMFLGYLSQAFFPPKIATEKNRDGYPPLYDRFSSFYSRYVYRRVKDCWNKPVCSVPGAEIVIKDRITKDNGWTFEFTGTKTKCLNLSSYNYLGFAEPSGPCAEAAIEALHKYGVSTGATRQLFGTTDLHNELEALTAEFLGVEDAITFGMGFATNALNIPTLLSKGCLVLSDEKNHASLILGLRLSGATIKVFRHNCVTHLEQLLKEAVYYGQPTKTKGEHIPWKKIFIVVEGVYSMEGTIVHLPKVIELKKKYKAILYLDEAHSIGAMGEHGGGIVDYFGCDPKDVDILMGTFTKSFGSAGGYIAGKKELVSFLRQYSFAAKYAWAMSPPVAAQIVSSMRIIMGKDGTGEGKRRIKQLARNSRYFRRRLAQIGMITFGNQDSPVVPVLVYLFSKIGASVRTLQERKIATIGVGYPATPLMEGRLRICLSASHTKEQLDYALKVFEEVADEIGLRYSRLPRDPNPIEYDKIPIPYDLDEDDDDNNE